MKERIEEEEEKEEGEGEKENQFDALAALKKTMIRGRERKQRRRSQTW